MSPLSVLSQTLIALLAFSQIVIIVLTDTAQATSSNYSTFVYRNCRGHNFTDSTNSHTEEAISSFYKELVTRSDKEKFYKTTVGDDNYGVSGHFQCRGDISNNECHKCITSVPKMSDISCNRAVWARIQLLGCYVHYEADHELIDDREIINSNKYEMLHRICDEKKTVDFGFEQVRGAAFSAAESCMVDDGDGYCKVKYELMQVIAQCEGDLRPCDCGECVGTAVQIAQEECDTSLSGQIYLDHCFVGYGYYPDGIPDNNKNQGRGGLNNNTGKLLAIVLGGAAALAIGYMFLLSLNKLGKKDDVI